MLVPSGANALELTTIAGTVDGQPVTVADANRAAGGVATATWRAMDAIVRTAVRGLCAERIQNLLAEADGLDPISWRARIWQNTEPAPDEVAAYAETRIPAGTDTESSEEASQAPNLTDLGHELHVKAYREKLARTAERMLGEDLVWNIPNPNDAPTGEMALPSPVATCVGRPISVDDVRRYAAVPLYERASQLVSALCAQFQTDPPKPLVLDRAAARTGRTLDQLMTEIEGDPSDIPGGTGRA